MQQDECNSLTVLAVVSFFSRALSTNTATNNLVGRAFS